MPNARKLTILTDYRRAAGVTLEQMARLCGFSGTKSRETVAAWERGQSVPHKRNRAKFIDYLGHTLGLRDDPARFGDVWDVVVEEWDWEPLGDGEWQEHFSDAPAPSSRRANAHAIAPVNFAEEQATLTHMLMRSTVPPPAPLPANSRMPLHRNRLFAGREHELQSIAHALARVGVVAVYQMEIAATTGIGGIGKTQLACEFVHRYGQFFSGGVFWLSFGDSKAIPSEVAMCGGAGRMALRPDFSTLPLQDQVELVLAAWREPIPRLLVFDNCEDEVLLARWRPTSGGCVVLVTSRRMSWEPTLGVQQVQLGVLERAESVTLLRGYFGGSMVQPDEMDALAEELGDLPLALHLAGSYLARYRSFLTPAAYLAQLQRSAALDHPSLRGDVFSPTGHIQHVGRTFSLSVERLDPSKPTDRLAQALLARAACFAPGELIPRDILLATVAEDEQHTEDALVRLMTLGLVEAVEHGAFRLHRLVVQFVLGVLYDEQAQADVERAVQSAAERLADEGIITAIIQLQPQLRFVAERALERSGEPAGALATTLGHHLWLLSEYQTAQAYLERALALREQAADPSPLHIAAILNILGLVAVGQSKFSAALEHARRALTIWETYLGHEHPTTDAEVNNIGYAHMLRGDYPEADIAFRRSLAMRHRIFGLRHRETARVLHNLGMLNLMRNAYRTAHRYFKLALVIREQLMPSPNMSIAMTMTYLGEAYFGLGEYAYALAYHHRALAMWRAVFGEVHIGIATSLTNLGRVMRVVGEIPEAWDYQLRAMAMHEMLKSTGGYEAAYMLDELGVLSFMAGDYESAQTYLERALANWERIRGMEHPERAAPLLHLGQVLCARGDRLHAQSCLEQALRLSQDNFVAQHPLIADTRKALEDCM